MVDIVVDSIPRIHNNQQNKNNQQQEQRQKRKLRKDRRKNRVDRRQSVRDGIVVTLSNHPERRSGTERRKP